MKRIIDNYTFSKGVAGAGTVTFTDFTTVTLPRLLLITDVNTNQVIYNFAKPGYGATASGNIVTLDADTSSLNNADPLQIIYEADESDPLFNTLAGEYNATPPSLANGAKKNFQLDGNGRLIVTLGSLIAGEDIANNVMGQVQKPAVGSQYTTGNYDMPSTAVTKAPVKVSAGNVYALRFTNASASTVYLQLHNSATSPAANAVPQLSFAVTAGATLQLESDYFSPSEYFSTAIAFGISSAYKTFVETGITASNHTLSIRFV